jgi:hypothetical protein
MYPAMALAMNAKRIANTAMTADTTHKLEIHAYIRKTGMVSNPIIRKTNLILRSWSVLFFTSVFPPLIPATASLMPAARFDRSLKIVNRPPTTMAPTPMYRM